MMLCMLGQVSCQKVSCLCHLRVPLITTRCAGRFTPMARVEVVHSTCRSKQAEEWGATNQQAASIVTIRMGTG
jgi:hypothetical protein